MPPRAVPADPSQLMLALFDEACPRPAPASAPAPPAAAAASLSSVLVPVTFRHPRSNREVRLQEHVVGYEFRRVRRRTIGF
jgi:hypothetical protein